jgi:hypothetical protein
MNTILITVSAAMITLVVTSYTRRQRDAERALSGCGEMNVEESTFTAPNQRDARQAALALVTGLAANRSFETDLPSTRPKYS